jgi:hypothetical protein
VTAPFDDGWAPVPAAPAASGAGGQLEAPPALMFPNVDAWVRGFLSPHLARRLGGTLNWCAKWYRHTEAVSRLTAMWLAWEHLRLDGALGPDEWWRHHADPHLAVLMSHDTGPFAACRPDHHVELPWLPCEPAPEEMWASSAFSEPPAP